MDAYVVHKRHHLLVPLAMPPTTQGLPAACRALLAATASLPGATSLPAVRAIMEARRALAEALAAAPTPEPRRAARQANVCFALVEAALDGAFWPQSAGLWAGEDGVEVRLYRRRVGPVNCVPLPGSIATRTRCSEPVPALMGWWSVRRGGHYLGYVQIHRGQPMDRPPVAAVAKVVARASDHREH